MHTGSVSASAPLAAVPAEARVRDALRAAHLYYLQEMKMEAIAAELQVSRSSVSRLLRFARDTGLVDIRIHSPFDAPLQLEAALRARFGVAALVVPVGDRVSSVERLDRVARAAARLVVTEFASNTGLGLAWGSTIDAVSRHLARKRTSDSLVLQLNGAGNLRTTGIGYASEILRRFGEAFGAQVQQLPVPAFFDDPATRTAMWRERSMHPLLEARRRIDVALFGIGSPFAEVPSHVYAGGYLGPAEFDELAAERVVGDVATMFYRLDGSSEGIGLNARSTGMPLDALRAVPRRICVVAGRAKLDGTRGALAAGLVTDLVLDEDTAREL